MWKTLLQLVVGLGSPKLPKTIQAMSPGGHPDWEGKSLLYHALQELISWLDLEASYLVLRITQQQRIHNLIYHLCLVRQQILEENLGLLATTAFLKQCNPTACCPPSPTPSFIFF